jgi:hypothetical protein
MSLEEKITERLVVCHSQNVVLKFFDIFCDLLLTILCSLMHKMRFHRFLKEHTNKCEKYQYC